MGTNSTKKFLRNNAGYTTEEYALTTSAGAADANRIPALNASGILDDTITNASATGSASKLAKMNASGYLDASIMNATSTSVGAGSAGKTVQLNASGLVDNTILNATTTSAGAGSANKVVQLNASGLVDDTIMNASNVSGANKVAKMNASGILDDSITNASVTSSANKLVKMDGTGKVDVSVLPTGIGADTQVVLASEALAAGDLVNIWNNAGTANVRKADGSTTGKEAMGFVLSSVASGANATVYFEGTNTQCTGLTPGRQYLGTTAGKSTSTAPSATGQAQQLVGIAVSATALNFDAGEVVQIA